jgi:hypothetical protein
LKSGIGHLKSGIAEKVETIPDVRRQNPDAAPRGVRNLAGHGATGSIAS